MATFDSEFKEMRKKRLEREYQESAFPPIVQNIFLTSADPSQLKHRPKRMVSLLARARL
jgi:hypothetical protein